MLSSIHSLEDVSDVALADIFFILSLINSLCFDSLGHNFLMELLIKCSTTHKTLNKSIAQNLWYHFLKAYSKNPNSWIKKQQHIIA